MGLWTKWHAMTLIPAFAVMIVIGLVLRKFLKDKDEKYRMIPIQVIAVTLLVLEVGKQIYSIVNGYDLYHIPLHFCSLFLYFLPLFAFYKGKYKNAVRSFTTICSSMLLVFLIIYPTMIYGDYNIVAFFKGYLDFHTVAFHNLAALACVLIIALDLYKPDTKRDIKSIFIGYGIYSFIAALFANLLSTNYNGFYRCGIDAIKNVQLALIDKIGWAGQLIYNLGMTAATFAFGLVCYGIYRGVLALINLIKNKKKTTEQTTVSE